ncbi:hypothetical protein DFQ01_108219, partial [Paenibacillus cellulosilyticus]
LHFFSAQCNCLLSHSDIISEQLWGDIITAEQQTFENEVDFTNEGAYTPFIKTVIISIRI